MIKHTGAIEINKPIETVTRLFADSNCLHEWQDGFIRKELQSGQEGQKGAVSKMYYKYGKHDMELTETVVANNLPVSFEAFYHHKHLDNTMIANFTALSADKTLYEYTYEYTRMAWIMPRLMAILFPGIYRKQGEKWMRQFKEFVERQ